MQPCRRSEETFSQREDTIIADHRSNRRWRSSPDVTVALTRKRSLPSSTVASGFATKLWYHAGCLGAPANEAITTSRSPSVVYTNGFVIVRPLLAPVIVKSSTGILASCPPTFP